MIRKLSLCAVYLVVGLTARSVIAKPYNVVPGSEISFLARITGGSFVAKSTVVSGVVDYDESTRTIRGGSIVVRADSFTSGMSSRDAHTRDKYLEADKFPAIRLELKQTTLQNGGRDGMVDGTLVIKGARRPVQLKVQVSGLPGAPVASSSFPVNVTDYGIPQPKFAVVKMDPTVEITVKISFQAAHP